MCDLPRHQYVRPDPARPDAVQNRRPACRQGRRLPLLRRFRPSRLHVGRRTARRLLDQSAGDSSRLHHGLSPAQGRDPRRHHRLSEGAALMAKPVHSMIRVLDEARSLDFYARAFDLEVADHLKFDDFALIYLRHPSSPFEVELTVNFDRKEPYALGDGYGHLAVIVDNVDAEHSRFEQEKLSPGPLRDFKHNGKTLARFFFVTDPDGYKIEVIQRGGRFG